MPRYVLTPMQKLENDTNKDLLVVDGGRQIVDCNLTMARECAKDLLDENDHYEEVTIHRYELADTIHRPFTLEK